MSNPSRSKGKVNISGVWLVVTVSVEGLCNSEHLCGGILCAYLVTEQIQQMASRLSLLHKHGLFNSISVLTSQALALPSGSQGRAWQ